MNRVVEDSPIVKLYWTPKEISDLTGISVPMVFYWWNKFRIKGHRTLSAEEVDKVRELAQKEG